MTDYDTKSTKDFLSELSELAKQIQEYQIKNPPTYYFVRESDDTNIEWRKPMIERGWVRQIGRNGLPMWVKDLFEPIGVIPDSWFPEEKDGARIEVIGVSQSSEDASFTVIGGIKR